MREIVIDTETTGLNPKDGHRIIEIAAIELIDKRITPIFFHVFIDPEREIDEGAYRVHGISRDKLKDKPKYAEIQEDFWRFVNFDKDTCVIAHNFSFDESFICAEQARLDNVDLNNRFLNKKCTLEMARWRWPSPCKNSLDDVCRRIGIDISERLMHGALIDALLCAKAYITMSNLNRESTS